MESVDGDLDGASAAYQRLVRNQPADHPARAKALYHLGRTHYTLGDHENARKALLDGVRTIPARPECLALLGQLELEQSSVKTIPLQWRFDDDNHGIVHPWEYAERGSTRIEGAGTNPMLAWRSTVDVLNADRLVIGFRVEGKPPTFLEVKVAASQQTRIQVLVTDIYGEQSVAYAPTSVGPSAKNLKVGLAATRNLDQVIIEHMATKGAPQQIELQLDDLRVF
jgi:tetratricopeptide (TPR) repeat protein